MCYQVVWVNYQIMSTVGWNVRIAFPPPFRTFERLLSVLDLSLLRIMPVACIVPCECNACVRVITKPRRDVLTIVLWNGQTTLSPIFM
jgi:hypothetical protein